MVNIAQVDQTGKGKIEEIAARNDTLSLQILLALLFAKAFNPDSGLTLRSIANAIGAHPQQVKRRIMGDKRCQSRLKGLVRWENGRGRKGTKVWLSKEGMAATIAVLAGVTFSHQPQSALFEDPQKWLQVLALFATDQNPKPQRSQKNVTPTLKNSSNLTVSFKDENLTVPKASGLKTFIKATIAIFNEPLARNDYGLSCVVGRELIREYGLDGAIGIVRHAKRAWIDGTPRQVLLFARRHNEALFEAYLRDCERRENLKRIRAIMRPFEAPTEKPKPALPNLKGDRTERAAEIIAADQPLRPLAARSGKKRCPRCGAEGFELPLKRFERYFPHIPCPEADRYVGAEICGYCLKDLRLTETKEALAVNPNGLTTDADPSGCQPSPMTKTTPTDADQAPMDSDPLADDAFADANPYQPDPTEAFDDLHDDPADATEPTEPDGDLQADDDALAEPIEALRAADQDLPDDDDAIADATAMAWASDGQNDPNGDGEICPSLTVGFRAADNRWASDPTDDDLPDDSDDESEPLPPLKCELCGRSEGEPHPALQSWQRNDFLCLSELSDAFKQRFGLPECGLLCRGCYLTLCASLVSTSDPDGNCQSADQDAPANEPTEPDPTDGFWAADSDIAAEATLKATEPTEAPADQDTQDTIDDNPLADNAADDDLADATNEAADQDPPDWAADEAIDDSDGQNDPSGDKENCPSPLLPLPDSAAEGLKPIVRDLLISHQSDGATEIVRDGITYRLKDFHCLDDGKAFALIEADPITMSPLQKALIDELFRLHERDGTVAIERDGFRVEIAEVIPVTQGKTLYRVSITKLKLGRGRKR